METCGALAPQGLGTPSGPAGAEGSGHGRRGHRELPGPGAQRGPGARPTAGGGDPAWSPAR